MEEKNAVVALAALAQESRLRIFRHLARAGPAGRAAGQIADALGIPPATLSFHLKELAQGGLVEASRRGRSNVYSVRIDGMRDLLAFLADDCCEGRPDLCGVRPFSRAPSAGSRRAPRSTPARKRSR